MSSHPGMGRVEAVEAGGRRALILAWTGVLPFYSLECLDQYLDSVILR